MDLPGLVGLSNKLSECPKRRLAQQNEGAHWLPPPAVPNEERDCKKGQAESVVRHTVGCACGSQRKNTKTLPGQNRYWACLLTPLSPPASFLQVQVKALPATVGWEVPNPASHENLRHHDPVCPNILPWQ